MQPMTAMHSPDSSNLRPDPLDVLVDKYQISYTQAMEREGIKLPPLSDFTAEAIQKRIAARRAREADAAYYAEEFHLTGVMSPQEAVAQQAINEARDKMPWEKSQGA